MPCSGRLNVPLIDRRRIASERLAYQVAADPYRLDVGQPVDHGGRAGDVGTA